MEYKNTHSYIKSIDGREVTGLASIFGNVDSGMDRVWPGAFTKSIQERGDRVKHLWQHDSFSPPIATVLELREVGREELPDKITSQYPEASGGLLVKRSYLDTPRGNEILAGLKSDPPAITEMSFAYDIIKADFSTEAEETIRELKELRLWETSDVIWGMNEATVASKAIPYLETGILHNDSWDQPTLASFTDKAWEDLDQAEIEFISSHFAYSKTVPAQSFEDLQYPHHRPAKRGLPKVSHVGLDLAFNQLITATLPDKEREAVFNHLSKHYSEYGEEDPRSYQLIKVASSIQEALSQAPTKEMALQFNNILNGLRASPPMETTPAKTSDIKRKLQSLEIELLEI